MIFRNLGLGSAAVLALAVNGAAQAAVSGTEAARLGNSLTPVGAVAGPNQDGSIPAWSGDEPLRPDDFLPGQRYVDPYADDERLFTINNQNFNKHAGKLSAGHLALFKKYDSYKMVVYPSRRGQAFPQEIYQATQRNALTAELTNDGNNLEDAAVGFPFPIPQNGEEVIWNHRTRYRGDTQRRYNMQIAVMETGELRKVKLLEEAYFKYARLTARPQSLDNLLAYFRQETLSPPREAGQVLIVHETIDQKAEPRNAWTYNLGQRRVRSAPDIAFDARGQFSEGLRTVDQADMFNGSLERYNWKLVGQQERYIPYNSYLMNSDEVTYAQMAKPGHLNQSLPRYELHRVWVVEATLKDDVRHLYEKRVFYVDEDSWQIAMVDVYDGRDQLWRFQEAHTMNLYDIKGVGTAAELVYDMATSRYLLQNVNNQEPPTEYNVGVADNYFAPTAY